MSERVYEKVREEVDKNDYDVSCATAVLPNYDRKTCDHFMNERRLGHSHSLINPDRSCYDFDRADVVKCYYLFGETLLVNTHHYGECAWKKRGTQ